MKRSEGLRELLDGPLDSALLEGNLRDLTRINRWLGGARLSWQALIGAIDSAPGDAAISLLDVGTGAADIPRELLRRAENSPLKVKLTATDVRPEVVASAQARSAGVRNLAIALGAGTALDYREDSFDVVHCSLVLHHFEPDHARRLLAEMGRVARLAVIVNDLDRARRWWLAAWLLTRLTTGNQYTRHDAPLSVRRAYHPAEVVRMASAAGLRATAHHRAALGYRYSITFVPQTRRDE